MPLICRNSELICGGTEGSRATFVFMENFETWQFTKSYSENWCVLKPSSWASLRGQKWPYRNQYFSTFSISLRESDTGFVASTPLNFRIKSLCWNRRNFRDHFWRNVKWNFQFWKKNGWKEDLYAKFWKSIFFRASWFAEILILFACVLKHLEQLLSPRKILRLDNSQSHIQK